MYRVGEIAGKMGKCLANKVCSWLVIIFNKET